MIYINFLQEVYNIRNANCIKDHPNVMHILIMITRRFKVETLQLKVLNSEWFIARYALWWVISF